jgi:outer membrane murein-binding lipoprotein Lpp
MKNILKISIAALASAALLSGCIKETFPTDRATSDQLAGSASALEAMVKGIPTALIQVKSLTDYGNMHWNFSLPAIHLATDSAAGDMAITGDTGYDWFSQWGANDALAENYAANLLTWNNYSSRPTTSSAPSTRKLSRPQPSISSASLMLTGLRSTSTWYVSMSSRRINTRPQTECSALPYRS